MAGERQVAGFAVDYSVLPASRKLLEDARALVLSRDVYAFYDGAKMCGGFQPKVGLRFWRAGSVMQESVDVLICFNCDDVAVRASSDPTNDDETIDPFAGIGSSRSRWVNIARRALPEDAQIQSYSGDAR